MKPEQIRRLYTREGYTRQGEVQIPPPPVTHGPTPSASLRWHLDARGSLVEVWRRSWGPLLRSQEAVQEHPLARHHPGHVAQVYVSTTRPGVVKGWHAHAEQWDRFVVVRGAVLVATLDLTTLPERLTEYGDPGWESRSGVQVQETVLDSQRGPQVLTIPPGTAHGWMALDHTDGEAWVMNLCSREFTGLDEWRRPPHGEDGPALGVRYNWRRSRDG